LKDWFEGGSVDSGHVVVLQNDVSVEALCINDKYYNAIEIT